MLYRKTCKMGKWPVTTTYQCVLSAETAQCTCPHHASLTRQIEPEQEGTKQLTILHNKPSAENNYSEKSLDKTNL